MEGTSLDYHATAPLCVYAGCEFWAGRGVVGDFLLPSAFVILAGTSCLHEQKWNIQTCTQRRTGDVSPPPADPVTSGMTNRPQVCESGDLVCATEALLTTFPQTTITRMSLFSDRQWWNLAVCICIPSQESEEKLFVLWAFFQTWHECLKGNIWTEFRKIFEKHMLAFWQKHNIYASIFMAVSCKS